MKPTKIFLMSILATAVFLLLVVALSQAPQPALAQGKATPIPTMMSDTTISVSLANPIVGPEEEFDILVNIATDTPTWSAQIILTYDPTQIEVLGATEGTFYSAWAQANGVSTFSLPIEPDNEAGRTVFAVTLLGAPAGQGPTGAGDLVTYRARTRPNASGEIALNLEEVIVSDTAINDADKIQTQILGGIKVQNGLMTIGSDAAAAPPEQPTPEPLLEPTANVAPSPTPAATIARRADSAQGSEPVPATGGGGGIPWIIILPIAGAVVIGGIVLVLSRRK